VTTWGLELRGSKAWLSVAHVAPQRSSWASAPRPPRTPPPHRNRALLVPVPTAHLSRAIRQQPAANRPQGAARAQRAERSR